MMMGLEEAAFLSYFVPSLPHPMSILKTKSRPLGRFSQVNLNIVLGIG